MYKMFIKSIVELLIHSKNRIQILKNICLKIYHEAIRKYNITLCGTRIFINFGWHT